MFRRSQISKSCKKVTMTEHADGVEDLRLTVLLKEEIEICLKEDEAVIQEIIIAENQILVKLSCGLYAEEAAQVNESLLEYFEKGYKTFLIDFGDVDYIEHSGL